MNTKNKQEQKTNHPQKTQQQRQQGPTTEGQMPNDNLRSQDHEQEHPETRLTR